MGSVYSLDPVGSPFMSMVYVSVTLQELSLNRNVLRDADIRRSDSHQSLAHAPLAVEVGSRSILVSNVDPNTTAEHLREVFQVIPHPSPCCRASVYLCKLVCNDIDKAD